MDYFGKRYGQGKSATPITHTFNGEPFMFVAMVNNGPMIARRDALIRSGGWNESFACPGQAAEFADFDLSLQFWKIGYHVGLIEVRKDNGVGKEGRKSRSNPKKRQIHAISARRNLRRTRHAWEPYASAADAQCNIANLALSTRTGQKET